MSIVNPTVPGGLKTHRPSFDSMNLKMLVYSDPGIGKTTLIGTADKHPKLGPTLFINAEGGMLALANDPPETWDLVDPEDPEPTPEKALARFEQAYWFLKQEKHPFKSVALDTLGELIRIHMQFLAASENKKGRRSSIHDTQLQDYNATKNYLTYWLGRFRDLPLHFFVACHAETKTRADGVDVIRPLIFDKLLKPVEAMFDVIGYMTVTMARPKPKPDQDPATVPLRKVRKLEVDFESNESTEIHSKDRSPGGRIGKVLLNPTMPMIYDRIVKPAQPAKPTATPTEQGE